MFPCSMQQPQAGLQPHIQVLGLKPAQPLFAALLWINPLSIKREMLLGRQACVASPMSRGLLMRFICPYPFRPP